MEIAHILEELAYDMGELPREAIEAAIAHRAKITPYLLDILRDATTRINEIIEQDNYQGHLYAMYLLAQFRASEAMPHIVELISFPGDIPHAIVGDVLTEDMSRILASVYSGDLHLIKEIIENPLVNEHVRAAATTSLTTLVGCSLLPRKEVIDYFRFLMHQKLEKRPSFVWDNLISCCCDLYPEELIDEIHAAFNLHLINSSFITLEEVETILSQERESHLFRLFQNAELIEDTVSEMEKWLSTNPNC